jgi:ATP-binding cassette, subfamily G (WHITE), member 2, SNQ2
VTLANQVCPTVGAVTGQPNVDGNRFIQISFDHAYGHIWRGKSYKLGSGPALRVTDPKIKLRHRHCAQYRIRDSSFVFSENNTHIPGEKSITFFKRGPRTVVVGEAQEKASVTDEERGNVDQRGAEENFRADSRDSISVPMMTDVFTWRHLQYDVTVKKGETRRPLDDVSGFVAPGKLTALMGRIWCRQGS